MNTDDLRRVLAEHEDLAPGMTGMIDRIRDGARRRARRRRRAAATGTFAAVAAVAVAVPLALANPGPGRPVGGPPPDRPDRNDPLVVAPLTVAESSGGPRVTEYTAIGVILTGNIRVITVPVLEVPDLTDSMSPVTLSNGTGYATNDGGDDDVLVWRYAPGKWAQALGGDLGILVPLSARVRDQPRPLRFPYRLDSLGGLTARVAGANEAVAADGGVVSRLELTLGTNCSPPPSPPRDPPVQRCGTTSPPPLECDRPMAFPSTGGPDEITPAGPSVTPEDCGYPPGSGLGGTVTIEVSNSGSAIAKAVPEGNGRWRITRAHRTGLVVEKGDWFVSVTTPGSGGPFGNDEIERIVDGLTLLPVDDRSAWTDDPLP